MSEFVVCSHFDPGREAHYAVQLTGDLQAHGHEWDITQVRTPTNKAWEIMRAMDRHPGSTIVYLDVDARVVATLDELPTLVRGDIGLVFRMFRNRRAPRLTPPRFAARTGLVVAQQTPGARRFLATWDRLLRLRFGIDWNPAGIAMWQATDVSFSMLPVRFAATRADSLLFANVTFY
jgi:hypothetical protein